MIARSQQIMSNVDVGAGRQQKQNFINKMQK